MCNLNIFSVPARSGGGGKEGVMRLSDARGRRDYVPPTGVGSTEAECTCG